MSQPLKKATKTAVKEQLSFLEYPVTPLHLPVRLVVYIVVGFAGGTLTFYLFQSTDSYWNHLPDSVILAVILDWLYIAGYWIRRLLRRKK